MRSRCVVGTDAADDASSYGRVVADELPLETYCDLVVRMRSPALDDDDCVRIANRFGVTAGDWTATQVLWTARLADPVEAPMWSRAYLDEYQAALRRLGASSPSGGTQQRRADDEHVGRG